MVVGTTQVNMLGFNGESLVFLLGNLEEQKHSIPRGKTTFRKSHGQKFSISGGGVLSSK